MTDSELDDIIRQALTARAEQVRAEDLSPASPPTTRAVEPLSHRLPWRWGVPLLAAAAVVAALVGTSVIGDSLKSDNAPPAVSQTPTPNVTPTPTPTPTSTPTTSSSLTKGSSSPTTTPSSTQPVTGFDLGYEPLWPFASFAQAEQWRSQSQSQGSQPWHLDPDQTALSFTTGFLGFTEIDRVTSSQVVGREANVGVGYLNPNSKLSTAAVIHLVRFGESNDAPWEVVGSNDTDFSIENPPYGSSVSSPVTVGGRITGVDESIHIWVRQVGVEAAVGEQCCNPAGGENTPWSQAVSFTGSGTLTLVASTGGHVQGVERFAIHGVHTR